jgi:branched-chain amino acid transport system substrate-binding protein
MKKSFWSIFLAFVLLTVLVSGCTPAATAVPPAVIPTGIPSPTSIPPTLTPEPSATATTIPTATATPFVPKATIKIVSQSPLSGDQSAAGISIQRGVQLAVAQLAGPLQDLGYKIVYDPYDDQASIDPAVKNAKEIIADPQVLCGVGHYNSSITLSASGLYHLAGLAFISPSNTAPKATSNGFLEINRVVGRDDVMGASGAKFAQDQAFKSVFVVRNSGDWINLITNGFISEANKLGIKIVGNFVASDGGGNFESIINSLMKSNADMVYYGGFGNQAGPFFKQARLAGYTGTLMTFYGTSDLIDAAGALALEGSGLYYTDTGIPASYYPGTTKFLQDFQSQFGTAPQSFAAEAYDAAGICLKAIEQASKAIGGEIPTRHQVALAIRALKDYAGIAGTYNFTKKGDQVLGRYFIMKVISPDPNNWGQNTLAATIVLPTP